MGFESSIYIYRVYKDSSAKIDSDLYSSIHNNYKKGHEEIYNDQRSFELPVVIDRSYNSHRYSEKDGCVVYDTAVWDEASIEHQRDRFYAKVDDEYMKADLLNRHFFGSNFTALSDHFHMRDGRPVMIGLDVARRILEATQYMLNGKFDKQIERVMNNEFIECLGEEYMLYRWCRRKKDIYVKKIGNGEYTISLGDDIEDAEIEEENETYRYILERLRLAMETYLNLCDENYCKNITYVMEYSISY